MPQWRSRTSRPAPDLLGRRNDGSGKGDETMTAARFAADLAAMLAERFERGEIGRRRFLALLGAAGLAPAVLRSGEASAATKEIIIANFGGDGVPAWQKAWADPYNAESGNKATVIGAEPSAGAIKAQVESGKVTWGRRPLLRPDPGAAEADPEVRLHQGRQGQGPSRVRH